jgi:hypothetical protein
MMKKPLVAMTVLALSSGIALADAKPSDEEAKKIGEALSALGYTGGTYEKESEASGVFEIDDAKDKSGRQFDIKLDKDFKVLSITAD